MVLIESLEELLKRILSNEFDSSLENSYQSLSASDKAQLIESVPFELRTQLWSYLAETEVWDVITCLQSSTSYNLINSLSDESKQIIQVNADAGIVAAYAESIPKDILDNILLDLDDSDDLQQALSYEDDQVGRYLQKNFLRVRTGISVKSVINRLKKKESIAAVFLVDDSRELLGYIPISSIFNNPEDTRIEELSRPVQGVLDDQDIDNVARTYHFEEGMTYVPVLRNGKVFGAISVSSILNSVQLDLAALTTNVSNANNEDLFSPLLNVAKPRAFWLCINLATAFLASWVIGIFEVTLQQFVALAILMPVVASMGGIAGSQTLAVTVRGLALGHVSGMNIGLLFSKEMKVALLNGIGIGLLIAVVVAWWFNSIWVGAIIWIAVACNSLAAAASGTYIPFVLQKMNVDPAVASAVILTTVTDVMGFFIFLGLGSVVLT